MALNARPFLAKIHTIISPLKQRQKQQVYITNLILHIRGKGYLRISQYLLYTATNLEIVNGIQLLEWSCS